MHMKIRVIIIVYGVSKNLAWKLIMPNRFSISWISIGFLLISFATVMLLIWAKFCYSHSSFTLPSCAKLHCKVILKELHCQWPNYLPTTEPLNLSSKSNHSVSSSNLVNVWLKQETFWEKKALIWPKKDKIMYCNLTCTLMCIEVSYYYSVKSFSRSKSPMYTTLHLKKCFEKGKQQKAMN